LNLSLSDRAIGSPISGIVYKTVCLPVGKVYVGLHCRGDRSYLGSGKYLRRAIHKYGRENFCRETLAIFSTLQEGLVMEQFWIHELGSKAPNGYNLTDGGEGGLGCCPSAATRQLMREHSANKGKPIGEKLRTALCKANKDNPYRFVKGNPAWNKGKPMSEESRAKLSKACRGRCLSIETRSKISVSLMGNKHLLGHHHSDETRAKMSEHNAMKRPEVRAKLSKSLIGNTRRKDSYYKIGEDNERVITCISQN